MRVWLLPVMASSFSRFPRGGPPGDIAAAQAAMEEELKSQGVQIIRVQPHPIHYALDSLPVRRAAAAIIREHSVDFMLGWHQETWLAARLARRQSVIPGMIAAGSYGLLDGNRPRLIIHRWLIRRSMQAADIIFALSNFTKMELISLFGIDEAKIRVAHWGIDPKFLRVPARVPENHIRRLLFFGKVSHEKGAFDLFEALGKLAGQGARDWELRIAGQGKTEAIDRATAQAGIAGQVTHLGFINHAQLMEQLAWAQVAILPSHSESFGLAVVEAQAAGLPVIACNVGAMPEIIVPGETGWLAPARDSAALAAAIAAALESPEQTHRMGLAGRARVEKLFSWEQTANGMLAGLQEAARGG